MNLAMKRNRSRIFVVALGLLAASAWIGPAAAQSGAACTRIDASNVFECDTSVFTTTVGP